MSGVRGVRRDGPCWELVYDDGLPWDEESNPHYGRLRTALAVKREANVEHVREALDDEDDAEPRLLHVQLAEGCWEASCARCGCDLAEGMHWPDAEQAVDSARDRDGASVIDGALLCRDCALRPEVEL